mmetsp:Transcript_26565/g.85412  ORF Transcript_26565/g.85412 Transcript_26565/m.85412 type:complete len:270 (+) Transcript_26565:1062-1871(+)
MDAKPPMPHIPITATRPKIVVRQGPAEVDDSLPFSLAFSSSSSSYASISAFVSASSSRSYLLKTFVDLTSPLRSVFLREFEAIQSGSPAGAGFSFGNSLAETVQPASPAWAGFSSGNSLIDGSGAPPAAAGLRAVATLVAGLSAGSFLMTPVSSKEASVPDLAAAFLRAPSTAPVGAVGGPVGRGNLDQKTAVGRGAWVANMALALSESFLRMLSSEASAPDFAGTSFTRAFLAPHASAPRSEGDSDANERTIVTRPPSPAGTKPTFAL